VVATTISQRVGSWTVFGNRNQSDDSQRGLGSQWTAGANRGTTNDFFWLGYSEIGSRWFPGLGRRSLTDAKGFEMNYNRWGSPRSGPTQEWYVYGSASRFTRLNGDRFTENLSMGAGIELRSKWSLEANLSAGHFAPFDDHDMSLGIAYPNSDPFRNAGISYGVGRAGGVPTEFINLRWVGRPSRRFYTSASATRFVRAGTFDQIDLTATWDVGLNESLAVRAIYDEDRWNLYGSYRLAGRKGNELFVLLGDPQAGDTRTRLALKALIPVEIKF
ncbi:MAG: hypothetical protein MH204_01470, partial [Fimbriimonadaceae bacterium]|nr:hypothetical protein [Fimbriimonadaceae bacterium]